MRIEPPPSVPSAIVVMPAASAAPAPPEDPPAPYSRFHGLRVVPQSGLWVLPECANSGVVVRACITTPASSRRSTAGADRSGRKSTYALDPYVVTSPATECQSLIAHGTPSSGLAESGELTYARSAFLACARARSKYVCVRQLMLSFVSSMRSMSACRSSTGESSLLLKARIASPAER